MQPYRHVQYAVWVYLVTLIALPIAVLRGALGEPIGLFAVVVWVVFGAVFGRLTTSVDEDGVSWSFGWVGFPGGNLALAEIADAATTQTSFFEGWGIHWTIWHGWLWNTSGFQAVEFTNTSGGRITVGTDDPQGLCEAVERFRRGAA